MAYVPKERKFKITWKVAIVAIVVVAAAASFALQYLQKQQESEEIFTICGYNQDKTLEILKETYADTYAVSDYLYYGESLNLYHEDYSVGTKDDMNRKSVELVNLCDSDTSTNSIVFTMEAYLDRQIDVSELKPGFYALFVNDNLVKKRLVYDEKLHSDSFLTIKRDDKVNDVRLLADVNMLADGSTMDKNYLFLQVEETEADDQRIDVFLDPFGYTLQDTAAGEWLNPGYEGNDLKEYQETYDAAVLLKEKLEAYGLRVEISKKKADEALSNYGADSRMARAYASKARYLIEFGMSTSQYQYRGMEIYHSNYSSEILANAIMYAVKKNTELPASNAYTWSDRSEGVGTSAFVEGLDGLKIYDALPSLRESGGRATGAARYSNAALTNESFAKDANEGMMAVSINPIYISSSEDAAYWKEHKDEILTQIADAFAKAVHVAE